MIFGSVFGDGLRRFLEGEEETLTDAMLATVEARDFGGPAFKEYWRREALDAVASCEVWARETREKLITPGEEWEIEVAGHTVRGRHGPVVNESGEHVLLRIKTGKNPMKHADAAVDPDLALSSLGADADRAKYVYPRKLSYGAPAERELDSSDGLEGFKQEAAAAVAEMEAGEIPARPRSEEICGRCAFISICPLHMEDEPWAG
jgi:PD-(D/E)XK nuclease superfamily